MPKSKVTFFIYLKADKEGEYNIVTRDRLLSDHQLFSIEQLFATATTDAQEEFGDKFDHIVKVTIAPEKQAETPAERSKIGAIKPCPKPGEKSL